MLQERPFSCPLRPAARELAADPTVQTLQKPFQGHQLKSGDHAFCRTRRGGCLLGARVRHEFVVPLCGVVLG